jgi:hypothetical protein
VAITPFNYPALLVLHKLAKDVDARLARRSRAAT